MVIIDVVVNQPLAPVPNDPALTPVPLVAGNWTYDTPTSTVTDLAFLEGAWPSPRRPWMECRRTRLLTVSGGSITLPNPGTKIHRGPALHL